MKITIRANSPKDSEKITNPGLKPILSLCPQDPLVANFIILDEEVNVVYYTYFHDIIFKMAKVDYLFDLSIPRKCKTRFLLVNISQSKIYVFG